MTTQSVSTTSVGAVEQASWLPLVIIVLAQLQMGFNINALPVSIGPIAEDLNAPATAISTALVMYSLFVAAFVMLAHGISMALMTFASDASTMDTAQVIAGISAAMLVPTLVVLIAFNYRDQQQTQALGILASIPAISSGVVSERIPITVSSTVCPVWGSRSSIGIGSNVPSSK